MALFIASSVFILGYLAIAFESKLKVSKSAFALATGSLLWVILALYNPEIVKTEIVHVSSDIFNIIVFLLAAMSLVEILVHYGIFDVIRTRILSYRVGDKAQFVIICTIAFFLSAIIDNLTTAIVMIQIARRFFKDQNLVIAAVGIVIAANAGGAFSPIGDVTTIMLWLAGKFTASEVLIQAFLPAAALFGVSVSLMMRRITESHFDNRFEIGKKLTTSEKAVIILVGFSFFLPVFAKHIGLPPVLGLLLGVGITWMIIDVLKTYNSTPTHLSASIEHLIQKTDIASIKFFIGILLAVSALEALGVLEYVSHFMYGPEQSFWHVVGGNAALGMVSAILDNIPLTAIAINILEVASPSLWILLALTVGTGGSLLAIGSAAGVVAMGMVKELTFEKYFKVGFVPALLGFAACLIVWGLQYSLFFAG